VMLEIGQGGGRVISSTLCASIMITTAPPLRPPPSHRSPLQLLEKATAEFPAVSGEGDSCAQILKILKPVLEDFKALEEHHKGIPSERFNDDSVYKGLTAEAIDSKTLALNKARACAGLANRLDALARFLARPLADFATRAIELEEATGLESSVFPWEELLQCSGTVNFGRWSAKGVDPDVLRVVGEELAKNANLRGVTLEAEDGRPVSLWLPDGVKTKELNWRSNNVVLLNPGLACLLAMQCVELEQLDIR
jgi:hypothetical protein